MYRNKPSKSEVLTNESTRVKTLGTTRSVPRMPTTNGQDAVKCRQMSCASDVVIAVSFLATLLPFLAWLLAFAYIVHRAQRTSTSDATAPTPSAVDDSIEYEEKDGEGGPDGSCSDQSWVDGSEASDADVEFARPGEPSSNNKAGSKERKRDVRTTRRLKSKGIKMNATGVKVNAKSLMKENVPAISDSKSARKWSMDVKGTVSEIGAEMKDMATVVAELEANKPGEELDKALYVVDEAYDAVLVASGEAIRQSARVSTSLNAPPLPYPSPKPL